MNASPSAGLAAPTVPDLEAYWMPFTANRQFKGKPRMLARASGMYYEAPDGRRILDGVAGLWCVNAGHGRGEITQAVARQLETMDYAPPFQMGHTGAFDLANALVKIAPAGLDHVFFTNSGSESVDTALKIALAYHRVKGDAARVRLIGRERGYHGVGFGGITVGGMVANRKVWPAAMIPGVDHLLGEKPVHHRQGQNQKADQSHMPHRRQIEPNRPREPLPEHRPGHRERQQHEYALIEGQEANDLGGRKEFHQRSAAGVFEQLGSDGDHIAQRRNNVNQWNPQHNQNRQKQTGAGQRCGSGVGFHKLLGGSIVSLVMGNNRPIGRDLIREFGRWIERGGAF